jgi:hypothetical protein
MNNNILYVIVCCLVLVILYCNNQINSNETFYSAPDNTPVEHRLNSNATVVSDTQSIEQVALNTGNTDNSNLVPDASADGISAGACYIPNTQDIGSTHELDTCFINQMGKVENGDDYKSVVNNMRKRYKDVLINTMNQVYGVQSDITNSLDNVQNEFNKYGLESTSKEYYDTIYQHGNFASVKDRIILSSENNKNNVNNANNASAL